MVKEELAGRFSDFHALRYTFNTWLHTNGVPQRMAQELMRHSDLRLTDQVYLDSSLLPLQDCMRSIGHKNKWTQKWTQISGETSHLASRVVGGYETVDSSESPLSVGSGRDLSQNDEEKKWRDGRDSKPKSSDAQSQSEKGIPTLSPESLTQILTNRPDSDRQMLARIVQRWGRLSDELKRAVLRVVG